MAITLQGMNIQNSFESIKFMGNDGLIKHFKGVRQRPFNYLQCVSCGMMIYDSDHQSIKEHGIIEGRDICEHRARSYGVTMASHFQGELQAQDNPHQQFQGELQAQNNPHQQLKYDVARGYYWEVNDRTDIIPKNKEGEPLVLQKEISDNKNIKREPTDKNKKLRNLHYKRTKNK